MNGSKIPVAGKRLTRKSPTCSASTRAGTQPCIRQQRWARVLSAGGIPMGSRECLIVHDSAPHSLHTDAEGWTSARAEVRSSRDESVVVRIDDRAVTRGSILEAVELRGEQVVRTSDRHPNAALKQLR